MTSLDGPAAHPVDRVSGDPVIGATDERCGLVVLITPQLGHLDRGTARAEC